VGFDHRFAGSPWHISGQARFGQATGSSGPLSSTFADAIGGAAIAVTQTGRSEQTETHWLADFAIGRDLGIGLGPMQIKGGVRIAEINARTITSGDSRIDITFPAPVTSPFGVFTGYQIGLESIDEQRSSFRGIGPRLGFEGAVPFAGAWSFDYLGDVAVLLGTRRFQQVVSLSRSTATVPPVIVFDPAAFTIDAANAVTDLGAVFNVDAQLGLSYWVTPAIKVTGSYRVDAFFDALLTLDQTNDPGRLTKVDRIYHGPKLGVTGVF
jgi:hypothetical protein